MMTASPDSTTLSRTTEAQGGRHQWPRRDSSDDLCAVLDAALTPEASKW
jgi:hypothetical protein